jgi:hypothetical protein
MPLISPPPPVPWATFTPTLLVCDECGALVWDADKHAAWHAAQAEDRS